MAQPITVLPIIGTRPEAVKMAPLVNFLKARPEEFRPIVCVTAQHRQMLDQVLGAFGIVPDHDLDIMQAGQTLTQITTRALEGLERVLGEVRPDLVLAQGDTTTVLAASLAASYQKIAFGHVEAGLRTDNKFDPFPEEINRRLTGQLADLHFCPTARARDNLSREGVRPEAIYLTGNTVIDALHQVTRTRNGAARTRNNSHAEPVEGAELKTENSKLRTLLVTTHRRENWGAPLEEIVAALHEIVEMFPDTRIILPMHKNPVVREPLQRVLGNHPRVQLIEPPDYLDFVSLMEGAYLVLTDSGGVQEEAPALGLPVLVLRRTTERPEGVATGTARLVGTQRADIVRAAATLLSDPVAYDTMSRAANPYGDGQASARIAAAILHWAGRGNRVRTISLPVGSVLRQLAIDGLSMNTDPPSLAPGTPVHGTPVHGAPDHAMPVPPVGRSGDIAGEWTNRRILLLLALGTLIVSTIWNMPLELQYLSARGGEIFLTFVLAMSFTYLLRPLVNALGRTRVFGSGSHSGRVGATVVVFIAGIALTYLICALCASSIRRDVLYLREWFATQNPKELVAHWQQTLQAAIEPYQKGGMLPPDVLDNIQQNVPTGVSLWNRVQEGVSHSFSHIFSHLGFIVELILLPVLVFYFLTDGAAIRTEAGLLVPIQWRPHARRVIDELDRVLDGYIRGQVIMCLIAWLLVTGGLLLLHVPHAFTLGLIAGVTRAVPVIGPLLGGIPLVLICLITTKDIGITLKLLAGFTFMHFLESKVLLPKIIGHEVDLHPVSVIVALLLGLKFFGFLGIFLAVPIAAVLKVLLAEWHTAQMAKAVEHEANVALQASSVPDSLSAHRLDADRLDADRLDAEHPPAQALGPASPVPVPAPPALATPTSANSLHLAPPHTPMGPTPSGPTPPAHTPTTHTPAAHIPPAHRALTSDHVETKAEKTPREAVPGHPAALVGDGDRLAEPHVSST